MITDRQIALVEEAISRGIIEFLPIINAFERLNKHLHREDTFVGSDRPLPDLDNGDLFDISLSELSDALSIAKEKKYGLQGSKHEG